MVLILDGNSEIDAHARSNLSYLICSRPLIRLAVTNRIFPRKRPIFPYTCATCSELPYDKRTMARPVIGMNFGIIAQTRMLRPLKWAQSMVFILDGCSFHVAHV